MVKRVLPGVVIVTMLVMLIGPAAADHEPEWTLKGLCEPDEQDLRCTGPVRLYARSPGNHIITGWGVDWVKEAEQPNGLCGEGRPPLVLGPFDVRDDDGGNYTWMWVIDARSPCLYRYTLEVTFGESPHGVFSNRVSWLQTL